MIFRHSLRTRIVIAFCLFGAVLGTVYGTAVFISLDLIDDHLVDTRLTQEIEHIAAHLQQYPDTAISTPLYIKAYIGTTSMPAHIQNMVSGLAEGFHETYQGLDEYHIAVQNLPDMDQPLYLLYDVSALEFTEKRKLIIGFVLAGGVILIIALGLWIGWLTSRKVMAPVSHLAEQVNKTDPDNLPTDLARYFYQDEVGVLAGALEQSMRRVKDFVDREHQFTRDVSHELRTPVTVIKGAVELLKRQSITEKKSVLRPLNRIDRSVTKMESIIETLLWLSREDADVIRGPAFDVLPAVREVIEQNQYLIVDKPLEIELITQADLQLAVPPPLFQIALTNLIRNAIQYTLNGIITVDVRADRVVVSDTGAGIASKDLKTVTQPYVRGSDSNGFGLGLSIVSRLCHRFGWQLEIESVVGSGTTAQLIFCAPPPNNLTD
jgi:signal transduction histidine kinase